MARGDFQPFRDVECPLGYPLAASQSIHEGEPVVVNSSGALVECSTNPATVTGISAHKSILSAHFNGASMGAGRSMSVYPSNREGLFLTKNFATDGSGTAATPAQTDIGETAGFVLNSTTWYLDQGASNHVVRIEDVLGAQMTPITNPFITPGTATWVVFRFLSSAS